MFMGRMRPSLRRLGVLARRRHAGHLCWERFGASRVRRGHAGQDSSPPMSRGGPRSLDRSLSRQGNTATRPCYARRIGFTSLKWATWVRVNGSVDGEDRRAGRRWSGGDAMPVAQAHRSGGPHTSIRGGRCPPPSAARRAQPVPHAGLSTTAPVRAALPRTTRPDTTGGAGPSVPVASPFGPLPSASLSFPDTSLQSSPCCLYPPVTHRNQRR